VELQRKEPEAGGGTASTSLPIDLVLQGRTKVSVHDSCPLLLARHGGEKRKGFQDYR
jgi:hypothetical protein